MAATKRAKIGKKGNAVIETAVLDFQLSDEVEEIFYALKRVSGYGKHSD